MVLRRMVQKEKNTNFVDLGGEAASCLRETHKERWKAKPSPFLIGSRRQKAALTPQTSKNFLVYLSASFYGHTMRVLDDSVSHEKPLRQSKSR